MESGSSDASAKLGRATDNPRSKWTRDVLRSQKVALMLVPMRAPGRTGRSSLLDQELSDGRA
jgi:hypothetical protein